jgi:hypothetical protein
MTYTVFVTFPTHKYPHVKNSNVKLQESDKFLFTTESIFLPGYTVDALNKDVSGYTVVIFTTVLKCDS